MKLRETASGQVFEVELRHTETRLEALIDGALISVKRQALADDTLLIEMDGQRRRAAVVRRADSLLVSIGPETFDFRVERVPRTAPGGLITPQVLAPMPGKVLSILVAPGDRVEEGAALVVLEAMKMETTLRAEGAATIKRVAVAAGQMVDAGTVLVELSPPASSAPPSAA